MVHAMHLRVLDVVVPVHVLLGANKPEGHVHGSQVAVSLEPCPLHRLAT